MNLAQETFISSTMWTDRIGFAASLAALKKMKRINLQKKLVKRGKIIKKKLINIAIKYKLKIEVYGLDSMPSFKFSYKNSEELITYFTQEMLYEGFLASSSICISNSHDKKIIDKYHTKAIKNKVKIVHACGFDSIPSDFGVFYAQNKIKENSGKYASKISMRVISMKGGISGGTIYSFLNIIEESRKNKNIKYFLFRTKGKVKRLYIGHWR